MQQAKRCPSCKYPNCWIQATTCEQCGFDFRLGRKPRKRKITVPEDDDTTPVPAPTPVIKTYKTCPECHKEVWHAAPLCEHCNYSFIASTTHHDPEGETEKEKEERRNFLGYAPIWGRLERAEWMDNYQPGTQSLRSWANFFLHKVSALVKGKAFPECVATAAVSSPNPHLYAAVDELYSLYGCTIAYRTEEFGLYDKVFRMTEEEQRDEWLFWRESLSRERICVHRSFRSPRGNLVSSLTSHKPAELVQIREEAAKAGRPMVNCGNNLFVEVPPEWPNVSAAEVTAHIALYGLKAVEELPKFKKQRR